MDISIIYYYTILILSVGLSIKSCEYLYTINSFQKGKPFDYSIIGIDMFQMSKLAWFFNAIYSKGGVMFLTITSLVCSLIIFSSPFESMGFTGALMILLVVNLFLYYRHSYGLDGADQMSLLLIVTLFLCFVFVSNPAIQEIGVFFIALQLSLSYTVSGIAKLVSKKWRNGTAVQGILSTYTYGMNFTRNNLTKNKFLCWVICWMTIIIETFFPLVLFLSPEITLIFLAFGFLFHLSIAIVMGLNDFVWGFSAAYPAFYYLSTLI